MDFRGNDIEYLGAAMFINLRPNFPKLLELNDRNYTHIFAGKKQKGH